MADQTQATDLQDLLMIQSLVDQVEHHLQPSELPRNMRTLAGLRRLRHALRDVSGELSLLRETMVADIFGKGG